MNEKSIFRDLAGRLVTLLVIGEILAFGAAFLFRLVPDATLMRWHGITGEILYDYRLDKDAHAYILEDEAEGTVSFVMLEDTRLFDHRNSSSFPDIHYGSTVRLSDLEPLRTWYWHYNETSTDRVFCTEHHCWRLTGDARYSGRYLARGVTTEPERLEGQNVLFRRDVDGATVFCVLSETLRSVITPEDMAQSRA